MAEKLVEYLVKQKCFYGGAIREAGDTVMIPAGEDVSPEVFCLRKDFDEAPAVKEFAPEARGGMMAQPKVELTEREKLEEQARAYGIKFTKRTSTEDLKELVKTAVASEK